MSISDFLNQFRRPPLCQCYHYCDCHEEMPKSEGPQTMTCRDCGHVVEARITDAPYLDIDDPRLCGHLSESDVSALEGLRLTDRPDMRLR